MAILLKFLFLLLWHCLIIILFSYSVTMSEASNENNAIIGKWSKISFSSSSSSSPQSDCSSIYPDDLEFKNGGIYRGFKGINKNEFTVWDAGSYEILSTEQIKISTANDAEIVYTFSIKNNTLNFLDKNKCQFQYQKTITN